MAETPLVIPVESELRPAYYDDFHCLAEQCRTTCCAGWRITFDKKDYLSLRRQAGSPELQEALGCVRRIRHQDTSGPFYAEFDLGDGVCPLLRPDGLCRLQVECGHCALPTVCKVFPRTEAYSLSGCFERSLSPACEAVLELLWGLPDGIEFRADPIPAKRNVKVPNSNHFHTAYREIRALCIDLLQDRRHAIPDSIMLLGLALQDLPESSEGIEAWIRRARARADAASISLIDSEPALNTLIMFLSSNVRLLLELGKESEDFRALCADLLTFLGVHGSVHNANISYAPYLEARARYDKLFADRSYFMENLMVALFFHLHLPDVTSRESIWESYVNFCNLYSFYRFMAVLSCRGESTSGKEELFRCLVNASRGLIHNQSQQTRLRDELFQNDSATLAHMAVLLGG